MNAIEAVQLSKSYGRRRGVKDLNFSVKVGEIFGFLGPNGAGKTTTIRMLLDLIRPSSGDCTVLGQNPRANTLLRKQIGYLPGEPNIYDSLTGHELLRYFSNLNGNVDFDFQKQLIEQFSVDPSRQLRTLSKGNKQKLALVQAFMHRPKLLVLDEPTSGLDPLLQQEFQKVVADAAKNGATVFLSSHVLGEVQSLCERVAIIREGELVATSSVSALHENTPRKIRIKFREEIARNPLENIPNFSGNISDPFTLEGTFTGDFSTLLREASQLDISDFICEEPSLEEIFLNYYNPGGKQ